MGKNDYFFSTNPWIVDHLQDNNWAILSKNMTLPENPRKRNKVLFNLHEMRDVYGRLHLLTIYEDANGTSFTEASQVFTEIPLRESLIMAKQLGQDSIIYKLDRVCRKISTAADTDSRLKESDILATFDLSGGITYELFREILAARLAEPTVTTFEGTPPYVMTDNMYLMLPRPSYILIKKYKRLEEAFKIGV